MANTKKDGCIFCKIIDGEIPSRRVYEDDLFMAILDVEPANRGHVIILPKNHAADIFELPEQEMAGILSVAQKVATALKKAYHCDGVNILQNNGTAAGQTVFHLHVHVIPRFENDSVSIRWEKMNVEDMDEVCSEIRSCM